MGPLRVVLDKAEALYLRGGIVVMGPLRVVVHESNQPACSLYDCGGRAKPLNQYRGLTKLRGGCNIFLSSIYAKVPEPTRISKKG